MLLEVIVAGSVNETTLRAPALVLQSPISFWGGVSASDGHLLDGRFEANQRTVSGTALFISELRGSSSASSVLLELIYRGKAPAAIILDTPDAILALGAIVGNEMGWATPSIFRLPASQQRLVADGAPVTIRGSCLFLDSGEP